MDPQREARPTQILWYNVVINGIADVALVFEPGKSLLANQVLLLGVLTSLAVHVAAVHLSWTQELLSLTALDGLTWIAATAVASTAILVNELHKRLRPRTR